MGQDHDSQFMPFFFLPLIGMVNEVRPLRSGEDLEQWWREEVGPDELYACYAVFVALPGDEELVRYLLRSKSELGVMSGQQCLVVFTSHFVRHFDPVLSRRWEEIVKDHMRHESDLVLAERFGEDLSSCPYLIVFESLSDDRYAAVDLKGLSEAALTAELRKTFSLIRSAVQAGESPVKALSKSAGVTRFAKRTRATAREAVAVVIEGLIKALSL